MSKLRKLVRNPRLFVGDAVRNRVNRTTSASPRVVVSSRPPSPPDGPATVDSDLIMKEFLHVIPTDHARQVTAQALMEEQLRLMPRPHVVDLGAGAGGAVRWMRKANPEVRYTGVDIEWSPQVQKRQDIAEDFRTYDGVNLPFADRSVALMFSNQVLEHVRYPLELLRDVKRVLCSDGLFIGSVSQMEPYHSFSIYNFTIYGVKSVFEEAGLTVHELRPSIDTVSLIGWWRHSSERRQRAMNWGSESTLNYEIDQESRAKKWSVQRTNFEKLRYAGQVVFVASPRRE